MHSLFSDWSFSRTVCSPLCKFITRSLWDLFVSLAVYAADYTSAMPSVVPLSSFLVFLFPVSSFQATLTALCLKGYLGTFSCTLLLSSASAVQLWVPFHILQKVWNGFKIKNIFSFLVGIFIYTWFLQLYCKMYVGFFFLPQGQIFLFQYWQHLKKKKFLSELGFFLVLTEIN